MLLTTVRDSTLLALRAADFGHCFQCASSGCLPGALRHMHDSSGLTREDSVSVNCKSSHQTCHCVDITQAVSAACARTDKQASPDATAGSTIGPGVL